MTHWKERRGTRDHETQVFSFRLSNLCSKVAESRGKSLYNFLSSFQTTLNFNYTIPTMAVQPFQVKKHTKCSKTWNFGTGVIKKKTTQTWQILQNCHRFAYFDHPQNGVPIYWPLWENLWKPLKVDGTPLKLLTPMAAPSVCSRPWVGPGGSRWAGNLEGWKTGFG